jgi:hypothetical protein
LSIEAALVAVEVVHLVSKHRDRVYTAGRCAHWIKVKNSAVVAKEKLRFGGRGRLPERA